MKTEKPELSDVPETMLWTLHNRASEALRPDGAFDDPEAIRIYQEIDYDYKRSFGPAEPSHAMRSAMFDDELRAFLKQNPDGVIINMGEGLETQRHRVAGDEALWVTVDLPAAIKAREKFIQPDAQHLHIAASALDEAWYETIPKARPKYITAQGLLMYFTEDEVRSLLQNFATHFPGAYFMFDTIPQWLSRRTMQPNGWQKTAHYTTPKMPWGINRNQIIPTLSGWVDNLQDIKSMPFPRFPRGLQRWLIPMMIAIPILRRYTPAVVRLHFGEM